MSDLPPLIYTRPSSLAEALDALQRPGARVYAGGTDLLASLYRRDPWTSAVRELVDVKELPEASGFTDSKDATRIGALVTASQLLDRSHHLRSGALVDAAARTSAPALRARGTVGGNLMTPHPCGDIATALLALDASVEVAAVTGEVTRTPVELLLNGGVDSPGSAPLLLSVEVPKGISSSFASHGVRRAFSRSLCAVAVARRDGKHRVALAGMHARPRLVPHIAGALDRGEDPATLALDIGEFPDPRISPALLRSLILRAHERLDDRE